MNLDNYIIEDEFYNRVQHYKICALKHQVPIPTSLTLDGGEYVVFDPDILYVKDLSQAQIALFIRISSADYFYDFGDLVDWQEMPENRNPEFLDHEHIEQLLLDMEAKGYITLHGEG